MWGMLQMNEDERKNHCYLGDGVYAEWDGLAIVLRANDHRDGLCTDKIYLEPYVLDNLNTFFNHIVKQNQGAKNE